MDGSAQSHQQRLPRNRSFVPILFACSLVIIGLAIRSTEELQ